MITLLSKVTLSSYTHLRVIIYLINKLLFYIDVAKTVTTLKMKNHFVDKKASVSSLQMMRGFHPVLLLMVKLVSP